MVRVRNPWGDHHEWRGAFSDRSVVDAIITCIIARVNIMLRLELRLPGTYVRVSLRNVTIC